MDAQHWLDEVRQELTRLKLPRRYIKRLVVELGDHVNFMEDSMSTDAQESQGVLSRLGMPIQIAQRAAVEYRYQRFSARHPVLMFAAFPFVMLPLLWITFGLADWGLFEAVGPFMGDVPDSPLPVWIEWTAFIVVYGTMNVPIVLSASLVWRLAYRASVSLRWLTLGCLVLAFVASSVYPYVQMKTGERQGVVCFVTPYWNLYPSVDPDQMLHIRVPRAARFGQFVQVALPLATVAVLSLRQGTWRRRRLATS